MDVYGYRRIHVLLQHEGRKSAISGSIGCAGRKGCTSKTSRKKISVFWTPEKGLAPIVNEYWYVELRIRSMYNGKRFNALTALDSFSRERLAIHVDKSIKGEQVFEAL
ncbi:MAG: hypothetical protein VB034_05745 [Eubacteriales bacterium]|nr:hypothetical protein [Eubacteriales bacterium]